MQSLSQEQYKLISKYWEQRKMLNSKISDMEMRKETTAVYSREDEDTIFELLEKMDQEINQVEKDIEQLDCEYEEMLLEQGMELYDRSMEGDLFKFINDGPEALKEYLELVSK
jgi:DNA-directed RNA polymerase alpha subunit